MDSTNIPSKPLPPGRGFHRSDEFDNPPPRKPLPGIISVGISAVIVFHLIALGSLVLSAPSGPWPTPFEGPSNVEPPKFAQSINETLIPWYLEPLRMTHNYHFMSNRLESDDVYFEVRLKDANGKVVKIEKFPQADANGAVQHRQKVLAGALAGDMPVQPPLVERVPSPMITI